MTDQQKMSKYQNLIEKKKNSFSFRKKKTENGITEYVAVCSFGCVLFGRIGASKLYSSFSTRSNCLPCHRYVRFFYDWIKKRI